MTYSIIGILAALILLIINRDILWVRESEELSPTKRKYRNFLLGVLSYYVTDALWGILDVFRLTKLQYIDTSLYFVAMAASVMLWTWYVIAYLESWNTFDKMLYYTGNLFLGFEIIIVIVNFFTPVLFWFDESGGYHAGSLRYVTLAFQILMFLVTSVYTLYISSTSEGTVKLRHQTIGFFGIVMVLLISFQIVYPLLPLYAMGYMLGTCLLHSFVVEDEKEEYRKELEYANKAKTTFLNNMSHDIRTPMNAIIGFTTLSKNSLDNREQVEDYLDKIHIASQHLLSLINDVLDMSRIESGKMTLQEESVCLPGLVHDVQIITQSGADAKNINLNVEIEKLDHEYIKVDRLRLNQILLNILSNAVKFTPQEGTISLHIKELPPNEEGCPVFEFRIHDTGIGMSEEFRETIFDTFTRERTSTVSNIQGTGLGMAITKSIVDMMNGTILVDSETGKGTEFTVTIPCKAGYPPEIPARAEEKPDQTASVQKQVSNPFAGKRILLAEDNEMNQIIAENILSNYGFIIDIASDGEQAVEMLHDAPAGTYDVILMDIQMPKMDGYEAARQIRALEDKTKAALPIVAVTANAFEEDRRQALDGGMDGHLAKPYDIPAMMKMLEDLLVP